MFLLTFSSVYFSNSLDHFESDFVMGRFSRDFYLLLTIFCCWCSKYFCMRLSNFYEAVQVMRARECRREKRLKNDPVTWSRCAHSIDIYLKVAVVYVVLVTAKTLTARFCLLFWCNLFNVN